MKSGVVLLGIGGIAVAGYFLLRRRGTKFSVGDWIVYNGTVYQVMNNRERDEQRRLLYQLVTVGEIGYWFLVSEVDASAHRHMYG